MQILNLTKRGMAEIRRKNLLRSSLATGRNFLYYKADVENYIFDHSVVRMEFLEALIQQFRSKITQKWFEYQSKSGSIENEISGSDIAFFPSRRKTQI